MPDYLICSNPSCRLVLDVQDCAEELQASEIGLEQCPECASRWAAACPFCAQGIGVIWHGHHAHCASCHRRFYAKAA